MFGVSSSVVVFLIPTQRKLKIKLVWITKTSQRTSALLFSQFLTFFPLYRKCELSNMLGGCTVQYICSELSVKYSCNIDTCILKTFECGNKSQWKGKRSALKSQRMKEWSWPKRRVQKMRKYQHRVETIMDYQKSTINCLSSDRYLFDCR